MRCIRTYVVRCICQMEQGSRTARLTTLGEMAPREPERDVEKPNSRCSEIGEVGTRLLFATGQYSSRVSSLYEIIVNLSPLPFVLVFALAPSGHSRLPDVGVPAIYTTRIFNFPRG